MKQNYTDIAIVLDRSGSMRSVQEDTIGGFNRFLEDQKKVPGEATLTLVQFDHEFNTIHNAAKLQDVKPLDKETYVPRGNTALLDAIGRTIVSVGERLKSLPEDQRPSKVIFVIQTDGQENASRDWDHAKVMEMIKLQTDTYKWEFVFLGANQDAIQAGASIGIRASNAMSYASNTAGTQGLYASLSANVRSFRVGEAKTMAFNEEDRKKQKAAGATH